jgi:hypothetical protein
MTNQRLSDLRTSVLVLLSAVILSSAVFAKEPPPDAPTAAVAPATSFFVEAQPQSADGTHKFWDKKNCALFVVAAAFNGADFAVTRANLQSGGRELNPVVRMFGTSTPALAVNFVGETVGVVGLSYFFHKTGHHKLERAVSFVNIGSSASAVSFDLAHR